MELQKLKTAFVEKVRRGDIKANRRFSDGGGLQLRITPTGSASWVFRYAIGGKETFMGGGSLADVSLAQARRWAEEQRRIRATGDPMLVRDRNRKAEAAARIKGVTFGQIANDVIAGVEASPFARKTRVGWRCSLERYALPKLGNKPVAEIARADVVAMLGPIWTTKPAMARVVRQHIEAVFDAALARELIPFNPARLAEIRHALGRHAIHVRKHIPAARWQDVPSIYAKLSKHDDVFPAKALQLLILTACRSGEVIPARWPEFDLGGKRPLWEVPSSRMKGKPGKRRPHRVPLAPEAVALLKSLPRRLGDFAFPGVRYTAPINGSALRIMLARIGVKGVSPHGFRASFRMWAADHAVPRETAEACLAHQIGGVEGSYQRSDVVELRREVMARWARWCTTSGR